MRPKIYTVTIARNEDVWVGPALDAWEKFSERRLILDTGSLDNTIESALEVSKRQPRAPLGEVQHTIVYVQHEGEAMSVGEAMVERQMLIDRIPRSDDSWVVILDADEVYSESAIFALIDKMSDPEIDYIGTRPVPVGWDGKTCFYTSPLEPFDESDRAKYTTPYWCPKVTIHAMRRSRLDGVSDPRWGAETFYVQFDAERHRITDDFKPTRVPAGTIPIQFTGRTYWSNISYCHMSYVTRSSKWREIEQIPGSNAMDRCRVKAPAPHQLPGWFEVPESVRRTLATLERPF